MLQLVRINPGLCSYLEESLGLFIRLLTFFKADTNSPFVLQTFLISMSFAFDIVKSKVIESDAIYIYITPYYHTSILSYIVKCL